MKKTILIAAVMFLAFSVAASAQAPAVYTLSSVPVTTVTSCGITELTGTVILTQAVNSPATINGTFTINYGVPITSVAGLAITVAGGAATDVTNISSTADLAAGRLVLQVVPTANITSISVSGVRVNVAGTTLTSLDVTLSATGNALQAGQPTARVINSISSAIASVAVTPIIVNGLTPAAATATVTVTEGFFDAWVTNSIVAVTFSAVPAGIQLSNFPATITNATGTVFTLVADGTATAVAPLTPPVFTSASTSRTVFYKVTTQGANATVTVETLPIQLTVGPTATATIPLSAGTLATVTADMFPQTGTTPPVFAGTTCQKTSTAPFVTIVAATTNLLMPYSTTVAGYDTGIAIANATNDPFGVANASSITKQDGALTFWLFPAGGTPFSITPTGTAGGLVDGKLKSGSEFVYLLSSLLADAGKPADFSGYIFVVCNFTNAHGQYFISNFEAFTNGALMLVTPTPRTNFESLGN